MEKQHGALLQQLRERPAPTPEESRDAFLEQRQRQLLLLDTHHPATRKERFIRFMQSIRRDRS